MSELGLLDRKDPSEEIAGRQPLYVLRFSTAVEDFIRSKEIDIISSSYNCGVSKSVEESCRRIL